MSAPIRHAILGIGIATLAFVFLNNLLLLTRTFGRAARAAHGFLTTLGILALVYALLYRYDLVFTLEDTLRLGPGPG